MNKAKHINLPLNLIRRCKGDKNTLEMLACALIVKYHYQNSTLYNCCNIKNITDVFGVSRNKAKKLMKQWQLSDLFVYNDLKKAVFAKTFKDKTIKYFGKNGKFKANADYCYKINISQTTKLRDLVRQLREILALCVIHAKENDTYNIHGEKTSIIGTKQDWMHAIPQRKIARAIGLSRSSACRYMKNLEKRHIVDKTKVNLVCVISELNEETERQYRERTRKGFYAWHNTKNGGWSAWVGFGSIYHILMPDVSNGFKHVIHNYKHHATTQSNNAKCCEKSDSGLKILSCDLDGEGYWAQHS